jgi:hypothetical protein
MQTEEQHEQPSWYGEGPIYAIQRANGTFVRTPTNAVKRFSTAAGAKTHIDTLPSNGYKVVRYS